MAERNDAEDMLDIFVYESSQLLEELQEIVLDKKDEEEFDESSVNAIFRTMHTLKGSSAIMMYDNLTSISHKLEDVFYYIRESQMENMPHAELVDRVFDVIDFITEEIDKVQEGDSPDGDPADIIETLDEFIKKYKIKDDNEDVIEAPPEEDDEPTQFYIAPASAHHSKYYLITIKYESQTEMCNLRAYTELISLKEAAESLVYQPEDIINDDDTSDYILENGFRVLIQTTKSKDKLLKLLEHSLFVESTEIEEITSSQFKMGFDFIVSSEEDYYEKNVSTQELNYFKGSEDRAPAPGDYVIPGNVSGKTQPQMVKERTAGHKQNIISVSIDKINKIMDLVGEMTIAQAVTLQNPDLQAPGFELDNFNKAAGRLTKISAELQDAIMSMRMMPVKNTFQKMNRIVFDVSRKLGKEIDLEIIGEDTEVDKNIIEHISDPLMHLIRNSADHGIEPPDVREAAKKNRKGKIVLSAKNEGGHVCISVVDDGYGLDKEKIIKKAKKNGLLEGKNPDSLTDKEIYKFITYAGFSTNEIVTEYSGRGVGLDVVVKNIQSIGGSLEIDSTEGEGTEMTMRIPITLAIVKGLVMVVGSSEFIVEAGSVKQFINISEDMVEKNADGEEYVNVRGKVLPLIRLKTCFELSEGEDNLDNGIVVVLERGGRQICLFVDWLADEQEIVVKPVPSYMDKTEGLSGCTQLGDGSNALIIDVDGLIAKLPKGE